MSAYFVEPSTVTAILAGGLGRTEPSLIGNAASSPLRWVESISDTSYEAHYLKAENATEIGQMLLEENIASLAYRYSLDIGSAEYMEYANDAMAYEYPAGGWIYNLSAGDVVSAIGNYEYQSCEHEGWMESEAHSLCLNLKERILTTLAPGGSWGITQADLDSKRSGARSLMGMIGQ